MKLYLLFVLLIVLWLAFAHSSIERANAQADKCAPYDWIGERFDYQVNDAGVSNLPADAVFLAGITFKNSALWKYYSESEDRSYILVFLSFDPTQPPGQRAGQHDLCPYTYKGFGMGVN